MNDPWLPLIAALSGQRTKTPSTWPVRRVHRLDAYGANASTRPRVRDRERDRAQPSASDASLDDGFDPALRIDR